MKKQTLRTDPYAAIRARAQLAFEQGRITEAQTLLEAVDSAQVKKLEAYLQQTPKTKQRTA